jgi:DNA-binding NarL/FixJ family response regulator
MIKLILADDHMLMREGLKRLFALENRISVVAEAENGAQLLEQLRRIEIDLILLDMSMPGINGATLIRHIRSQSGSPPVLVLSMHNETQVVRFALAAGAAGYLTKDSDPATLISAIFKVASGGRFLAAQLADQLFYDLGSSAERPLHENLSMREFDIFSLLVQGCSVNEIATKLSISNKTVSTHKARIMRKLNCQNGSQLVRYAITNGLTQ